MERYGGYFRWAAWLGVLYGVLLLASWVLLAVGMGWAPYNVTTATATKLLDIYGNGGAAASARIETFAAMLLLPALPAYAIFLSRRTPGAAWGGLAIGLAATFLAITAHLLEGPAFALAAPGASPSLLASVPPPDVILLLNTLSDALAFPAMLLYYPWLILWGWGFFAAGGKSGVAAGVSAFAVVVLAAATYAGFAFRLPVVANAGIMLQTFAESAAFALGAAAMNRAGKRNP